MTAAPKKPDVTEAKTVAITEKTMIPISWLYAIAAPVGAFLLWLTVTINNMQHSLSAAEQSLGVIEKKIEYLTSNGVSRNDLQHILDEIERMNPGFNVPALPPK